MRLIDADVLVEEMEKEICRYWNENGGGYYLAEDAIEEVKLAPTVEAEPVIHGEWLVSAGGKVCTCPVCGDEFDNTCNYDIRKDWKRCPVCETKMG